MRKSFYLPFVAMLFAGCTTTGPKRIERPVPSKAPAAMPAPIIKVEELCCDVAKQLASDSNVDLRLLKAKVAKDKWVRAGYCPFCGKVFVWPKQVAVDKQEED